MVRRTVGVENLQEACDLNPNHLIEIADSLAHGRIGTQRGRPRQAELRRAVSATYYALFHTLALNAANLLVGNRSSTQTRQAWRQTYRALNHGRIKKQCSERRPRRILAQFPPEIQKFADQFITMQRERHIADYDPSEQLSRGSVAQLIEATRSTIDEFEHAARDDRRAFAVFVLFDLRRD